MRRRGEARDSERRAELERRLSDAQRNVAALQAELERLNAHTLEVARQFEQEAAARAEAEAISDVLRGEYAQMEAEATELRSRLAEQDAAAPSSAPGDGPSQSPPADC